MGKHAVVKLYNTTTWDVTTIPEAMEKPELLRYSADGKLLAIMDLRNESTSVLSIYDVRGATPALLRSIEIGQVINRNDSFSFCPTGEFLIVGGNLGNKLIVYRVSDWSIVKTRFNDAWLERSQINGMRFSPDGKYLYVVGTTTHPDGALAVYDMVNWVRLPQYKIPSIHSAYWIDISSTISQMALYDGDTLQFINLQNWQVVHVKKIAGGDSYNAISYSEDGRVIAVAGGSTGAVVFDTSTFEQVTTLTDLGVSRVGAVMFANKTLPATPFAREVIGEPDLGVLLFKEHDMFTVRDPRSYAILQQITKSNVTAAHGLDALTMDAYMPSESAISNDGELIVTTWIKSSGGSNA